MSSCLTGSLVPGMLSRFAYTAWMCVHTHNKQIEGQLRPEIRNFSRSWQRQTCFVLSAILCVQLRRAYYCRFAISLTRAPFVPGDVNPVFLITPSCGGRHAVRMILRRLAVRVRAHKELVRLLGTTGSAFAHVKPMADMHVEGWMCLYKHTMSSSGF